MRTRGTSLLEVLITLSVLALALGLVAAVVGQYSRILTRNDQKSLTVVHLQLVNQLADELSGATQLVFPTTSGTYDEYRFTRLNAGLTNRLPAPAPTPAPLPAWDPVQPAHLLNVHYSYDALTQELRRTISFPTGPAQTWVVATGLSGFSMVRTADNQLSLKVSFLEGQRLMSLGTHVSWWLRWP